MELLPVQYGGQKNAWMNSNIFYAWFHSMFIPHVCEKLSAVGCDCSAVLILDNCTAHPDEEEWVSEDGQIFVKFLPPNVTSLIQPMNQGVLEALKQ